MNHGLEEALKIALVSNGGHRRSRNTSSTFHHLFFFGARPADTMHITFFFSISFFLSLH